MSTAPLIIPHELPAPAIEVVPAMLAVQVETAVADASALKVTDAASYEVANSLVVRLHTLDKQIAAHGETVKKPLNNLLKAVRECLDRAADPVQAAKRSVQGQIAAWTKEQQRIADEARRAAEEEARKAREAAEKERQRLQAEADAKHAADVAAAEAKAKQEAEELAKILGSPVEPEAVKVAPAPVVKVEPVAVAAPAPVVEVPKSAVVTRKVRRVEITDEAAIPVRLGSFEIRPVDSAALKKALEYGLLVPGARMIEVEETAMARGVK